MEHLLDKSLDEQPDALHVYMGKSCMDVAMDFYHRYNSYGRLQDIHQAVFYGRFDIELAAKSNNVSVADLNNFGLILLTRFERLGQLGDLEQSITAARLSIELSTAGDERRPAFLNNLANCLRARSERLGQLADLEEAIEASHMAIELTPKSDPRKPGRLANLGLVYLGKHERHKKSHDLDKSIDMLREAVSTCQDQGLEKKTYQSNLSNALQTRAEERSDKADNEEAIRLARSATSDVPDTMIDKPAWLSNLVRALQWQYVKTDNPTSIEEGVNVSQKAVDLTSVDSSLRARRLSNAGTALLWRFTQSHQMIDLAMAIGFVQASVESVSASPFERIRSGLQILKPLCGLGLFDHALRISEQLMELLPQVNTPALSHADQMYVMSRFGQFASEACSLQLICGGPDDEETHAKALKLLETGRASVIGLAMDERVDTSELHSRDPDLLRGFLRLREILGSHDQVQGVEPRTEVLDLFNRCLAKIRTIEGFEDFLQAPTMAKMMDAASDSTIVYVNVTSLRSDAIIVTSSDVQVLPLPDFDGKRVNRFVTKRGAAFASSSSHSTGKTNAKMNGFLAWMWDTCVEPILQSIGAADKETEVGHMQRVHWIGAGDASSLPFHAAGHHIELAVAKHGNKPSEDPTDESPEKPIEEPADNSDDRRSDDPTDEPTDEAPSDSISSSILPTTARAAVDCVLSSYVPSIRALIHAQSRRTNTSATHKMLLATMVTTPQEPTLSGVPAEALSVQQQLSAKLPITLRPQPSSSTILHDMQEHTLFHFAGHGSSDPVDAARNSVIFEKVNADGTGLIQDPLSVAQLLHTDIPAARLAFLSACSTADNRVVALADEGLHLAAGFLVGGFPNVVAALWPTYDSACVNLSSEFYRQLVPEQGIRIDTGDVARALHCAARWVREGEEDQPLYWGPFVHYGV